MGRQLASAESAHGDQGEPFVDAVVSLEPPNGGAQKPIHAVRKQLAGGWAAGPSRMVLARRRSKRLEELSGALGKSGDRTRVEVGRPRNLDRFQGCPGHT